MKQAFDVNGQYHPFDLNLPRNLPKRKDGFEMFAFDSPLTEMGYLQSKLTGILVLFIFSNFVVKVSNLQLKAFLRV